MVSTDAVTNMDRGTALLVNTANAMLRRILVIVQPQPWPQPSAS